jgi:hypothetical protein
MKFVVDVDVAFIVGLLLVSESASCRAWEAQGKAQWVHLCHSIGGGYSTGELMLSLMKRFSIAALTLVACLAEVTADDKPKGETTIPSAWVGKVTDATHGLFAG